MENSNQIPESRRCEPAKLLKKSSFVDIYEGLQSLRKDEFFCDIKLETDDKKIIFAHKVILASASPYFHAMFTHFTERNHDLVVLKQLDSAALQLLVNFIYSGEIIITETNVQVLLQTANLLQLQEVKDGCCDFLESQLCPTNCFDIYTIADLYGCTKLMTISELYMEQHFLEVVICDEFLSLPSEQVIKLISSDKLTVPSEEKVFESVIRWVKHELGLRKCILPDLMEHVRLPLTSKDYILKKVVMEPLVKDCLKSKDYITEALNYNLLNSEEFIPQNIRYKPRYGFKVIFVVGGKKMLGKGTKSTEWYDPIMDRWHYGPEMTKRRQRAGLAVMKDNLVFAMGGHDNDGFCRRSVEMLDLSSGSPRWRSSVDMLVKRKAVKVGVINDCLYAVGGYDDFGSLKSAEVFDCNTQEWCMISSMSTKRVDFGVGVLNNLLYVVGGTSGSPIQFQCLDTVECYNPSIDTWTSVAKMSARRMSPGVGVLEGVMYAVGGFDGVNFLCSVEAYRTSTGIWTSIGDMRYPRRFAGVVALDGLLYVIGGQDETSYLDAVECYNPKTNIWTTVTQSTKHSWNLSEVVAINRPQLF